MFKITIKNTSNEAISIVNCSGAVISSNSEWEFAMGKITKRLIVTCPGCEFKMSVPHVDHIKELIGCVIGCSGCGKHLIIMDPGEILVFDDTFHKATKELPKGE